MHAAFSYLEHQFHGEKKFHLNSQKLSPNDNHHSDCFPCFFLSAAYALLFLVDDGAWRWRKLIEKRETINSPLNFSDDWMMLCWGKIHWNYRNLLIVVLRNMTTRVHISRDNKDGNVTLLDRIFTGADQEDFRNQNINHITANGMKRCRHAYIRGPSFQQQKQQNITETCTCDVMKPNAIAEWFYFVSFVLFMPYLWPTSTARINSSIQRRTKRIEATKKKKKIWKSSSDSLLLFFFTCARDINIKMIMEIVWRHT